MTSLTPQHAVRRLSPTVATGEIVALPTQLHVGQNDCRMPRPRVGSIRFDDTPLAGAPIHAVDQRDLRRRPFPQATTLNATMPNV
jgi:hypothetical protein